MILHCDKDALRALILDVSQKTGIRSDIVEKDYYLTLLLWELSQRQHDLPAYFKGGTALYKAIGRMKRFSEDIDITVEVNDCTRSQGKKRLEAASSTYKSLPRTTEKEREKIPVAVLPVCMSMSRSPSWTRMMHFSGLVM